MLSTDDNVIDKTIEAVGAETEITLDEFSGAGYVWHLDRENSDPDIKLINRSYPVKELVGLIGGPRQVTFRFRNPAAGAEKMVVLKHVRPWDTKEKPAQIINLLIRRLP